jgi:hypothetical protein
MKSYKSDYKLTYSDYFGNNRRFKSSIIEDGTLDLMTTSYLIYQVNMITNPLAEINLINGIESDYVYLEVKSNGEKVNWGNHIHWGNGVTPLTSASGSTDVYKFLCVGFEKYIGEYSYGFNY